MKHFFICIATEQWADRYAREFGKKMEEKYGRKDVNWSFRLASDPETIKHIQGICGYPVISILPGKIECPYILGYIHIIGKEL